jgi:hypothetical protein
MSVVDGHGSGAGHGVPGAVRRCGARPTPWSGDPPPAALAPLAVVRDLGVGTVERVGRVDQQIQHARDRERGRYAAEVEEPLVCEPICRGFAPRVDVREPLEQVRVGVGGRGEGPGRRGVSPCPGLTNPSSWLLDNANVHGTATHEYSAVRGDSLRVRDLVLAALADQCLEPDLTLLGRRQVLTATLPRALSVLRCCPPPGCPRSSRWWEALAPSPATNPVRDTGYVEHRKRTAGLCQCSQLHRRQARIRVLA